MDLVLEEQPVWMWGRLLFLGLWERPGPLLEGPLVGQELGERKKEKEKLVWVAARELFEELGRGQERDWPSWWELFGLQEVEGQKKEEEEERLRCWSERELGRARKVMGELQDLPLDLLQVRPLFLGLFL